MSSARFLCRAKCVEAALSPNGPLSTTTPFALQDLASFKPEIKQILSLNHMEDTLKTTIQTKQDLYTKSYKITINWGTIQVLERLVSVKVIVRC